MKRAWFTYVSIVAAILAGTICSTAFADKKGGAKFSAPARSLGGNSGGMQLQQLNRNARVQGLSGGNASGLQMQSQKLNLQKNFKKPQIGSALPGNFNSNQLGQPLKKTNLPGLKIQPQIGLSSDLAKKFKTMPGNKPQLTLNPDAIKKINPAIFGEKVCGPIGCNSKPCIPNPCNPCYNPCNNWCGPCWWWSPCWDPCYQSCYYPTIYTYPQTVVVPVTTTVVASTPVVTAAAEAPVATGAPAEAVMQIPVGATVTLQGKDLDDKSGMVVVQIDKISLPAQVNEWKLDSANVTLPMLGLAGPTKAQLWLVKADGAVAANIAVELLPAQQPQNGQATGQAAAPMGEVR